MIWASIFACPRPVTFNQIKDDICYTDCASIEPAVVQAQDVHAEFLCPVPSDSVTAETLIDWQLNGTYLRNLDTSNGLIRVEGRNGTNEVLIIATIPQYNNTIVACVGFYIWPNGSVTVDQSPPTRLIIQGNNLLHHLMTSWQPILL